MIPTSIQIQIDKYVFEMSKVTTELIKKSSKNKESLKQKYINLLDERERLLYYISLPRISDEEYMALEIY